MPRHDWNTTSAHIQKPHHRRMHSPAHGKGGDRKLKAVKRGIQDLRAHKDDRRRGGKPDAG